MMFAKEEIKDGEFCPYVQGKCIEKKCKFWVGVRGEKSIIVSGQEKKVETEQFNCAIVWQLISHYEVAGKIRANTAATESFRNEYVAFNNAFARLIQDAMEKTRMALEHKP